MSHFFTTRVLAWVSQGWIKDYQNRADSPYNDAELRRVYAETVNEASQALKAIKRWNEAAFIDVRSYGAKGDGITNDTTNIRAALNVAAPTYENDTPTGNQVPFKKVVYFPMGNYNVGGADANSLEIPSDTLVIGEGATMLLGAGRNTPVFDINGQTNVEVRGFNFRGTNPTTHVGIAHGVFVHGASKKITITGLQASSIGRDLVSVDGDPSAFGDFASEIMISDILLDGSNASRQYGIFLRRTRDVIIDKVIIHNCFLDAIKVGDTSQRTTITNFVLHNNGDGGPNGNGIDAFSGGEQLTISNGVVYGNNGSAINIKSGINSREVNQLGAGYVRDIIISNVRCFSNTTTNGINITQNDGAGSVLSQRVKLSNIESDDNVGAGFFIDYSLNFSLTNCSARGNTEQGFSFGAFSIYGVMTNCVAQANGTAGSGRSNFQTNGRHQRFINCIAIGSNLEDITAVDPYDVDPGDGSWVTANGFATTSNANDIAFENCQHAAHTTYGYLTQNTQANGAFIDRQTGSTAPRDAVNPGGAIGTYGGLGSRYYQSTGKVWEKQEFSPHQPRDGWRLVGGSLIGTAQTIASGVIALPGDGEVYQVAGQVGTFGNFDTLFQINGAQYVGQKITLRGPEVASVDVKLEDGRPGPSGNLRLNGDVFLSRPDESCELLWDGSNWQLIGKSTLAGFTENFVTKPAPSSVDVTGVANDIVLNGEGALYALNYAAASGTVSVDNINSATGTTSRFIDGQRVVLRKTSTAGEIELLDGAGNLRLNGTFTLRNAAHDRIELQFLGGLWVELSRSAN